MKKIIFILPILLAFVACSNEKSKIAKQNNELVKSHSTVIKKLRQLEKYKDDSDKFVKQAEDFLKVVKQEKEKVAKKEVVKKLDKVKELLFKTLDNLEKGYASVIDLYKNGKKLEAKNLLRKTELAFSASTNKLVALQTEMAKENGIKVKSVAKSKKSADKKPADKKPAGKK